MDLVSSYKGVVGLVFGNENSSSNEDSYVEKLLDRIHNGTLCDDRRSAIVELQSVVAESQASQLAFGAVGFPVLLSVLKEERDDVEMVRGSLETLVSALTPIGHRKGTNNEIQPALMNTDLLSRESESISLLISLLSEEDFYVRYYTLQLLTALLTNSLQRIQEEILEIPRGITRLMDMLMDREVIRNEALLLLTYLTREAEEIQKIVVFEGVFEKIFSIIKEEGGSDGGVVVQDCLELLNNFLYRSISNQVLLRETIGFDPVISILKLRGNAFGFTKQKTTNMLISLETINLLILGGPEKEPGRDANCVTNRTVLVQNKALDHLLMLGVESQWAPVSIRRSALHCIGDLVIGHGKNVDALASKFLGEEPHLKPAFNSILRLILRTSSMQEFIAADYVLMCYCEKNYEGQVMLASTIVPDLHLFSNPPPGDDIYVSFGSMLMRGLTPNENDGDLESCCRAASVLSHILRDNIQCKEKLLRIELDQPAPSGGTQEPLMHRIVRYLALSFSIKGRNMNSATKDAHIQPLILKLLVIWLSECPNAVSCFLDSRTHLTYMLELVGTPSSSVPVRGLAGLILGECILYNRCTGREKEPVSVADAISRKLGLAYFFQNIEQLIRPLDFSGSDRSKPHKPLTRTNAASSMAEVEDPETNGSGDRRNEDHPILTSMFDTGFSRLIAGMEKKIRESTVEVYSRRKTTCVDRSADLEQRAGESDREYAARIRSFAEKQCLEIQGIMGGLAEKKAEEGGDVEEWRRVLEKEKAETEMYRNMAGKLEADLRALSDAYNTLERANLDLENHVRSLSARALDGGPHPESDDPLHDTEAELNDLLVCLGQEQTKVEKLSDALADLGVDVHLLLDGIGDSESA